MTVEAVLFEKEVPLTEVMNLAVGETFLLRQDPSEAVELRVGNVTMSEGQIGRIDDQVSVQVTRELRPQKMTMNGYEKAISEMEASAK